ncbi:cellulose biosynthesis protein BcsG [Aeromonas caviae]|nr:cellulose biosynthesis protein BcsG [Aeromonas caviae]MCR3986170.1 cellulose biosynthesis protein BcsG [Aeromonas caviae]
MMDHPLWKHFDIVFKNFNSATSYSGPAAVRLLRASVSIHQDGVDGISSAGMG